MDKFNYGTTSRERMVGVHPILILVAERALYNSTTLDWGVGPYGGLRTPGTQNKLFKDGKSKADGTIKKSYHQPSPPFAGDGTVSETGKAIDLVPVIGKMTWDNKKAFLTIKQLMFEAWEELKSEGKIPNGLYLHWGGFWGKDAVDKDGDGVQDENELGWDAPHYELRTYPQKINFLRIWDL